jgi:antitoxin FitA
MCGSVRAKPNVAPDEATIALFGPGVADMDTANATAEKNQVSALGCMMHLNAGRTKGIVDWLDRWPERYHMAIAPVGECGVGQLLVRNLDDRVIRSLKQRAISHGRSVEAEHRAILESVLKPEAEDFFELAARLRAEAPRQTSDSADLLRADRDRDHLAKTQ